MAHRRACVPCAPPINESKCQKDINTNQRLCIQFSADYIFQTEKEKIIHGILSARNPSISCGVFQKLGVGDIQKKIDLYSV